MKFALYKLYRRMAASPLPSLATPVPIGTSTPISQMRGQDRHQVTENEEETYESVLFDCDQCVYMHAAVYQPMRCIYLMIPGVWKIMKRMDMSVVSLVTTE